MDEIHKRHMIHRRHRMRYIDDIWMRYIDDIWMRYIDDI